MLKKSVMLHEHGKQAHVQCISLYMNLFAFPVVFKNFINMIIFSLLCKLDTLILYFGFNYRWNLKVILNEEERTSKVVEIKIIAMGYIVFIVWILQKQYYSGN